MHEVKLKTLIRLLKNLITNYLIVFTSTVNSHYCGHSRDHKLVSSIERVRNNGGLSQSNVYNKFQMGDFATVRISWVSVIARHPQGKS